MCEDHELIGPRRQPADRQGIARVGELTAEDSSYVGPSSPVGGRAQEDGGRAGPRVGERVDVHSINPGTTRGGAIDGLSADLERLAYRRPRPSCSLSESNLHLSAFRVAHRVRRSWAPSVSTITAPSRSVR